VTDTGAGGHTAGAAPSSPAARAPARAPERVPDPTQVRALFVATLRRATRSTMTASRRGKPRGLYFLLAMYAVMGLMFGLLAFIHPDAFTFSLVVGSATFMMTGMTLVAESSTLLFDPRDHDILGHRPIHPRTLLAARSLSLVALSLVLGLALNLVPTFTGLFTRDARPWFPLVHLVTLVIMSVFTAGTVVFAYALLARLVSRRTFDSIASWTQVAISVVLIVSYQIVPRLMDRLQGFSIEAAHPVLMFLPPTWFASLSMVMLGTVSGLRMWTMAMMALLFTIGLAWAANRYLAAGFARQVAALGEAVAPEKPARARARPSRAGEAGGASRAGAPTGALMGTLLPDPVERGAFRLARAYLARDRDMRMRIYPSLAMIVVFPVIAILDPQRNSRLGAIMAVFMAGTLPASAMMTFKMSPHYQAAELFRYAPIRGTAALFHGVRKAMILFLAVPGVLLSGTILWFGLPDHRVLLLAIPALMAIPTLSLIDGLAGDYLPLSMAPTGGRQGAINIGIMIASFVTLAVIAGLAAWAQAAGWLWQMAAVELAALLVLHPLLLRGIRIRELDRGGG
jgi:ABC-2 type transport system permease protein